MYLKINDMIYGYIRVSTEKQNTDVQKYEIEKWCEYQGIKIDYWVNETISGAKEIKLRKINKLLKQIKKNDKIICTEISRLGRSMQIVWRAMEICLTKDVQIISLKENYTLSNDPMSKFILSVYSYAAETERILISERTKEGLNALKRKGVKLGRPSGSKGKKLILDDYKDKIIKDLGNGISKTKIAKKYKVNVSTVYDFINRRLNKPVD